MTTKEVYSSVIALLNNGKFQQSLIEAEKLPFDRFLDFILFCKGKEDGINL